MDTCANYFQFIDDNYLMNSCFILVTWFQEILLYRVHKNCPLLPIRTLPRTLVNIRINVAYHLPLGH
jgi:hypothetical protein